MLLAPWSSERPDSSLEVACACASPCRISAGLWLIQLQSITGQIMCIAIIRIVTSMLGMPRWACHSVSGNISTHCTLTMHQPRKHTESGSHDADASFIALGCWIV